VSSPGVAPKKSALWNRRTGQEPHVRVYRKDPVGGHFGSHRGVRRYRAVGIRRFCSLHVEEMIITAQSSLDFELSHFGLNRLKVFRFMLGQWRSTPWPSQKHDLDESFLVTFI
jgi:hypothetical protein